MDIEPHRRRLSSFVVVVGVLHVAFVLQRGELSQLRQLGAGL